MTISDVHSKITQHEQKLVNNKEESKTDIKSQPIAIAPVESTEKHIKSKLNETISKVGKKFIEFLKIDDTVEWGRQQLQKLGLLENHDEFIYWNVGWYNFRRIFTAAWGYNVRGKANFPEYGPAILIANHQSELDPFLAGSAVQRKVQWVSKKENFDIPIFKSAIKPFGTIPLRRGESDQEALSKIRAVLENGGCVGMFPEGTRSEDGSLSPFHKGAARFCLELGVPFVPVAIVGVRAAMPKGAKPWEMKIGKAKIEIRVGKPVYMEPGAKATIENIKAVTSLMFERVKGLLDGTEDPDGKAAKPMQTIMGLNNTMVAPVKGKRASIKLADDDLSIS